MKAMKNGSSHVVYGALARRLAYSGDWQEVEQIAAEMQADGIQMNDFLYTMLLAYARSKPRQSEKAEQVFLDAVANGLKVNDRIRKVLSRAVGRARATQLTAMSQGKDPEEFNSACEAKEPPKEEETPDSDKAQLRKLRKEIEEYRKKEKEFDELRTKNVQLELQLEEAKKAIEKYTENGKRKTVTTTDLLHSLKRHRQANEDKKKVLMLKLKEFFHHADSDGSGTMTWEKFKGQLEIPEIKVYLKAIDLDQDEAWDLFQLLDMDDSNEIDIEVLENCKICVANCQMDTDKMKIYGARVKVDSFEAVADIEKAEKEKMKTKVDKIAKHGCNVFINRQLIYNYPDQLFKELGIPKCHVCAVGTGCGILMSMLQRARHRLEDEHFMLNPELNRDELFAHVGVGPEPGASAGWREQMREKQQKALVDLMRQTGVKFWIAFDRGVSYGTDDGRINDKRHGNWKRQYDTHMMFTTAVENTFVAKKTAITEVMRADICDAQLGVKVQVRALIPSRNLKASIAKYSSKQNNAKWAAHFVPIHKQQINTSWHAAKEKARAVALGEDEDYSDSDEGTSLSSILALDSSAAGHSHKAALSSQRALALMPAGAESHHIGTECLNPLSDTSEVSPELLRAKRALEEESAEQQHASVQATKGEACPTVGSTPLAQLNVAQDEPGAKEQSSAATKGKGKGKGKGAPPPPRAPSKGDGKGKAFEPRKPAIALNQDMKMLHWRRYMLGSGLPEGTIWDKVTCHYEEDLVDSLPKDELDRRYCRNAGQYKVEKMEQKKKPKAGKLDSIPRDQRIQMEVCLKTLPTCLNTGEKAVTAIRELDFSALTPERAASLACFLCPTPEQTQELKKIRELGKQSYEDNLREWKDGKLELKPEPFRLEPLEEYMEELAKVPACAMRLSCWSFIHDLPDKLNKYHSCLDPFKEMLQCFSESTELPFFLSLVLAFGNYLNGGTNEKRLGRADGFHVEVLGRPGGLDSVNDPQGRNLRQLIFKTYFDEHPTKARQLLAELGPLFKLVQRKISKDKDGAAQVAKIVRVQVEDLDKELTKLKTEFNAAHQKLTDYLMITDPADRFVSEVPKEFEQGKKRLDELVTRKDALLKDFKALLVQFHAETYRDSVVENGQTKDVQATMTSGVWIRNWDDLFMPSQTVLSFDVKKQKEWLEPRFCREELISLESLEILWGMKTPPPERRHKNRNLSPSHQVPFQKLPSVGTWLHRLPDPLKKLPSVPAESVTAPAGADSYVSADWVVAPEAEYEEKEQRWREHAEHDSSIDSAIAPRAGGTEPAFTEFQLYVDEKEDEDPESNLEDMYSTDWNNPQLVSTSIENPGRRALAGLPEEQVFKIDLPSSEVPSNLDNDSGALDVPHKTPYNSKLSQPQILGIKSESEGCTIVTPCDEPDGSIVKTVPVLQDEHFNFPAEDLESSDLVDASPSKQRCDSDMSTSASMSDCENSNISECSSMEQGKKLDVQVPAELLEMLTSTRQELQHLRSKGEQASSSKLDSDKGGGSPGSAVYFDISDSDCCDGEPIAEKLALKFKSEELANEFKEAFDRDKEKNTAVSVKEKLGQQTKSDVKEVSSEVPEQPASEAVPEITYGTLTICSSAGHNLHKADSGSCGDVSDPCVVGYIGDSGEKRTAVIENNLNPVWKDDEFEFQIDISDPSKKTLYLKVDEDIFAADGFEQKAEEEEKVSRGKSHVAGLTWQP